jgi:hypothetical protein
MEGAGHSTSSPESGAAASGSVDGYAETGGVLDSTALGGNAINPYASPETGIDIALGAIDTAYHYDAITAEQATAINDSANVQVYGIVHGHRSDDHHTAPEVDIEYQSADNILATLDPTRGDVLFTELYGHTGVKGEPLWAPIEPDPAKREGYIDTLREDRTILPGEYLIEKALLRGITVVNADMHEEIGKIFGEIAGVNEDGAMLEPNETMNAIGNQIRVEQAANTAKDFALAAQPWHLAEKPTYAVVCGKGHTHEFPADHPFSMPGLMAHGGLPAAFDRMGITYGLTSMPDAIDFRVGKKTAEYAGSVGLAGAVSPVDELMRPGDSIRRP